MNSTKGQIAVIIILIVVVLIVAGVGGLVYYKYSQSQKKNQQLQSQVNDLQKQINANNNANNNATNKPTNQTSTKCTKTGTMPTNGYVLSGSNSRLIAESELTNLTPWQLKVARNEIYARHGRTFVHQDLACYFSNQNWYTINPNFSESQLSSTENKNVATILNYEKKISSLCTDYDSGC